MSDNRQLLRHTLATVAYRGRKAVSDAPPSFATFRAGPDARTPGEILAHIGDLFDWALSLVRGKESWRNSEPLAWPQETGRFFQTLTALDDYLASNETLAVSPERLFQGPIADALTHIGQIAILRRLAGVPIKGENYSVAEIVAGRVGVEQTAPRREF